MPGSRNQRVAQLIRDELAALLGRDVEGARGALVTITSVVLTPDMSLARVRVSVFPDSADGDAVIAALAKRRGRLKRDIGRAIRIKRIPDLEFFLDDSARRTRRLEELLRSGPPPDPDEENG